MSLFSSSFEGSSSAGPSFQSKSNGNPAGGAGGKRKRPSLGDGGKDGQIRSTTANLQKLMKKVEGGNVASPKPRAGGNVKVPKRGNGEGGEAIGVIPKKKARKSFGDEEEEDTPRKSKFEPKSNGKGKKNEDSPAGKRSKTDKDRSSKDKEETPKKQKSSGSKIEPAELQLPHTIRADHEGSKEDEGLTKMQKDMKAKLEGARFRWINEQLYSTPSTEAVEMMQKDPKIFSDVSLPSSLREKS
jgi:ribosomal RNA-processing protein 8